jgi:hypothetical protein
MEMILGVLVVGLGGFIMGSGAWPFKLMKKYQFEHWWFIGMLVGLVIMPWTITLLGCPNVVDGLKAVPLKGLLIGNLFAFGWGIANVLCGICFVRIGVALTGAILAGLGVSVGTIVPMIFKGSGQFEAAADIGTRAGMTVVAGVAIMLVGVLLASIAGFGREREMKRLKQESGADNASCQTEQASGGFLGGLIMTVIAGVLSTGTAFTFIYAQEPIIANLSIVNPGKAIKVNVKGHEALSREYIVGRDGGIALAGLDSVKVAGYSARQAAEEIEKALTLKRVAQNPKVKVEAPNMPATFAAFAVGLFAGAVINIGYAVYLLTKNRSWNVLTQSWKEFLLAIIIGVNFSVAVTLMGKGMLLLGALGGSVGWGIQQSMQMTGGQAVGFISGEWRGVYGKSRTRMYLAIGIFFIAAIIMAYGNTLTK